MSLSHSIRFQGVASSTWDNISEDIEVSVPSIANSIYGYSKDALIEIRDGTRFGRFGFSNLLGKGVVITDAETGEDVWWGQANTITVQDPYLTVVFSLDNLANNVAVAYSYLGERYTTAWSSNSKSINAFGTLELLVSESDLSHTAAEARRDFELSMRQFPIPIIEIKHSRQTPLVTIDCIGWFETLKRRYWIQEEGYEGYTDSGSGDVAFGNNDVQYAAQSFQLSSSTGWDLKKVDLRIRLEESPTDELEVELRSGASIGSSSLIATSETVAYTEIEDGIGWITFEFATAQTLATGTTYWVKVQRTGAQNATNHYVWDGNEDIGYELGTAQVYDGSWGAPTPPLDMNFQIYGEKETTEQIEDILTDTVDFISTPRIATKNTSGVYSNQYKDDYVIAYDELVSLLELGDSSGNRMFITVTKDRSIFTHNESNAKTFILQPDAKLYDKQINGLISIGTCPFGCWIDLSQALPDVANTSSFFTPLVFIDEAEVRRGDWKPRKTRGIHDIYDTLGGNLFR